MKNIIFILAVLSIFIPIKVRAEVQKDTNHIYLNFVRKEVCSNRAKKCWPVAFGDKYHPTPIIEGPTFILNHYKNGFTWRNPFTGVVYKPGTHNLGNIWIQYTKVNGIDIGFHTTPYPLIPLSQQESKGGCIRMNAKDIKEFSDNIEYLDEIYAISQEGPITY
jgi:lipoprotein-anchoring transpeptidase ErfK/SrfK